MTETLLENIVLAACIVDLIDSYIRPSQHIRNLLSKIDTLKESIPSHYGRGFKRRGWREHPYTYRNSRRVLYLFDDGMYWCLLEPKNHIWSIHLPQGFSMKTKKFSFKNN